MSIRSTAIGLILVGLTGGVVGASAADVTVREHEIQTLLVAKLGDDAATIRVTLVKNKAILTGAVKQRAVQELAEEVALFDAGVAKVDNQVTAAGESALGKGKLRDEAADGALEAAVQAALKGEIGKHTKDVEIEAVGGWVSLRGTSPDASRRDLTLATTAKVDGVTKVIDLLRVQTK